MRELLPAFVDDEFHKYVYAIDTNNNDQRHMEYTRRFLALPEDSLKAAIVPQDNVNCLCGNKDHKTTNIFIPSCCFRSYHVDCYIKAYCMQISTNQDQICFCNQCKESNNVLLGVQDHEATTIEEVYEMEKSKQAIFKQFMILTEKDDIHR